MFLSKKLEDELKTTEKKPSIVNQQRVVYQFKCSFCDENYTVFTMRHLHERCEEHKFDSSSIKKHFNNQHDCLPDNINQHFTVLRKCKTKQFDSLIYEMLYIRELSPSQCPKRLDQGKVICITFFTTPSMQIMLSIYLNSSTCKYLSLDNGVTMTSKRRENINLVSFICLSFLVISFSKQLLIKYFLLTIFIYCSPKKPDEKKKVKRKSKL